MFKTFIIVGVVYAITIGWVIPAAAISGMSELKTWKKVLLTAVFSLIIGFFISGSMTLEAAWDADEWNGGVCPSCETEWCFVNADRDRFGHTVYYYICDNCGRIIEQNY